MSIKHNTGFADIIIHENDLAELFVNKNIELTLDMVSKIHNSLLENLTAPFFLLVNKENEYSYSFEAMLEMGAIEALKGIAFVYYTDNANRATQCLLNFPRETPWNVIIFDQREKGLDWLTKQK